MGETLHTVPYGRVLLLQIYADRLARLDGVVAMFLSRFTFHRRLRFSIAPLLTPGTSASPDVPHPTLLSPPRSVQ